MMSDYSKADVFQRRWSETAGFVPGLKDESSSVILGCLIGSAVGRYGLCVDVFDVDVT